MGMNLVVIDTGSADAEIRSHLDDFFKGRISYMRLVNLLGQDAHEVDARIAEVVCESIRRNTREAVLRH